MGYFIRVLGLTNPDIHIDELKNGLSTKGLTAQFQLEDENDTSNKWSYLTICDLSGIPIMYIERNTIEKESLGLEEIEEFKENIIDYKPKSAVKWLSKYLNKIKVTYAIQLLNAAFTDDNFAIVNSIKVIIWTKTGGILQADDEGFTNEDGYHILWQFNEDATGEWNMSIINFWGKWVDFTMDLGNIKHREDFWNGNIPKECQKI